MFEALRYHHIVPPPCLLAAVISTGLQILSRRMCAQTLDGWLLAADSIFRMAANILARIWAQILEGWLPRLWRDHRPQLAIFQAGVDALRQDAFGRSGYML